MADNDIKKGYMLGVFSYLFWGFSPIYFKILGGTHPVEVLAHRVVWGFLALIMVMLVWKKLKSLRLIFKEPRLVCWLGLSSVIIAANWATYIWAIMNDRMIEAALGYYLNPLVNVLLGTLILGERLKGLQKIALVLASLAIMIQLYFVGHLPWLSLILAFTFAFYGLIKRYLKLSAMPALTVETMWMLPLSILLLTVVFFMPEKAMETEIWGHALLTASDKAPLFLLIMSGIVTIVPLLTFGEAARYLPLSTLGFLQYIAPTVTFLLAIFIYKEPMVSGQWLSFSLIWLGLILFMVSQVNINNFVFVAKKGQA